MRNSYILILLLLSVSVCSAQYTGTRGLRQEEVDSSIDAVKPLGYINGLVIGFSNSTTIVIDVGDIMVNGTLFSQTNATTHAFTSLVSGRTNNYVYLDFSASTPSSPVYYDTLTRSVQLGSQGGGEYNTTNLQDRLIAAIWSNIGSATISPFFGHRNGNILFTSSIVGGGIIKIQSAGNPDGLMQDPQILTSGLLPSSAIEIWMDGQCSHVGGARAILRIVSKEWSDAQIGAISPTHEWVAWSDSGELLIYAHKVSLGPSRDIKWNGDNDDDNVVDIFYRGYRIRR